MTKQEAKIKLKKLDKKLDVKYEELMKQVKLAGRLQEAYFKLSEEAYDLAIRFNLIG